MAKILYLLLKRMRECERDQYQFTRKIKKARKKTLNKFFNVVQYTLFCSHFLSGLLIFEKLYILLCFSSIKGLYFNFFHLKTFLEVKVWLAFTPFP
jgi:hypothetical protein